ncbi:MAG: CBS domain-containing protein, partial [Burkholderiales bacterium]
YVTDAQGRLVGAIPLARLLLADQTHAIGPLAADQATPSVTVSERQDRIVAQFDKYNLLALPVVGGEGEMLGIVTVDDVLNLILPMIWKKRAVKRFV